MHKAISESALSHTHTWLCALEIGVKFLALPEWVFQPTVAMAGRMLFDPDY